MTAVYYSLAPDADGTRERQWTRSVRSLRAHNGSIPVVLCLYGDARGATMTSADELGVQVERMGEYPAALGDIPPHWRDALISNPTLHKLLSLRRLDDGRTPLLYLDCDTYFFGDVAGLFAGYSGWDFCAREEPLTLRSAEGYDWTYIDERQLASTAAAEGLVAIPAYNTGVMLFGPGLARTLVTLLDDFVWYAWRLLHGACLWRPDVVEDELLTALVLSRSGPGERRLALPYPAASIWIVEQVATWLTLGRVPLLAHGPFRREDVAQNGECDASGGARILAHYFTSGEGKFFARVDGAR